MCKKNKKFQNFTHRGWIIERVNYRHLSPTTIMFINVISISDVQSVEWLFREIDKNKCKYNLILFKKLLKTYTF